MTRAPRTCTPLSLACALLLAACGGGGGGNEMGGDGVRVNQVGYAPGTRKVAVVVAGDATTFNVVDTTTGEPVGAVDRPLGEASTFGFSGETVRVAEFTDVTAPGTYRIEVEGVGRSYPFEIGSSVYRDPALKTLKAFYYWRASTAIDAEHGGAWRRAAGHLNTNLPFHSSAAALKATTADSWSAPGGWYDAGDYGQYVVNAGITVGTMLALHELFPAAFPGDDAQLDIPESGGGGVSDLLDEVRYELEWMLAMQDEDGGVFFKIAGLTWPGWVMPAADPTTGSRSVIGKSTTSALDFAAVMAMAARIYGLDAPRGAGDASFAAECRQAAIDAYAWARANPDVAAPTYTIGSGPYGDSNYTDEFAWAAAELYATTGDATYLADVDLDAALDAVSLSGYAGWQNVKNLAYYSLAVNGALDAALGAGATDALRAAIREKADEHVQTMAANPYGFPLDHYSWGSASQVANVGVLLVYAARYAPDEDSYRRYVDAATQTADYVLGNNSTGYSFVTGVGDRTPMHIHHRPSQADSVRAPVPGLLTGGPNSGLQDRGNGNPPVTYSSRCSDARPVFCYTDQYESYSSNEPAINQNAAALFLFAALDALANI
ncbi:MAG TPA: glycoside hydrolase family 9 protein [Anaeromyxobacter sp.]|nr:glycoside hydrolase family 9 protein [Anaeromyxobacter sp.]